MRRAIVTSTATVSGIVLLLGLKPHGGTTHAAGAFSIGSDTGAQSGPSAGATGDSSSPNGSTGATSAPAGPASPAKPNAAVKTVTGVAAETRYGPVQLQVVFSGAKITKINVLDYPTESGRDRQINSYALPILNQEAMTAQSAQIDVVSGATYTSDGYAESLQSAIDKAKA